MPAPLPMIEVAPGYARPLKPTVQLKYTASNDLVQYHEAEGVLNGKVYRAGRWLPVPKDNSQ